MVENVIIIGSGMAGWAAAIYTARAGLKPLVIAGDMGGQISTAGLVENYPGFPEAVEGGDLSMAFYEQAMNFDVRCEMDYVEDVDFSGDIFKIKGKEKDYESKAVIIATGALARKLGVEGEEEFNGKGVSYCATCDGFFFKDEEVAIVGGGNTAVEEAIMLSKICKKVHLIHRGEKLSAENILIDRLNSLENIEYHWNSRVIKVNGNSDETAVQSISIEPVSDGNIRDLSVAALFVAIGHDPASKPFLKYIDHDDYGYLKVIPGTTKTNINGVFAAGDVADSVYRQAVTAAGFGCMSALDAEKWLTIRK